MLRGIPSFDVLDREAVMVLLAAIDPHLTNEDKKLLGDAMSIDTDYVAQNENDLIKCLNETHRYTGVILAHTLALHHQSLALTRRLTKAVALVEKYLLKQPSTRLSRMRNLLEKARAQSRGVEIEIRSLEAVRKTLLLAIRGIVHPSIFEESGKEETPNEGDI